MAAHPLLRRSQSYIPTSATKPPAGPPILKSGYCVKQGNVVSTGGPLRRGQWGSSAGCVAVGCLLPRGLGMLQGCSGCRTTTAWGERRSPAPSCFLLSFPEEELEAPVLCSG